MTTNQLPGFTTYNLGGHPCRAVTDPTGAMWIAAGDVAEALGMDVRGRDLVAGLPEGAVSNRSLWTPGGPQETVCLSVEGMMLACLRTRGPAGDAARKAMVAAVTATPQLAPGADALARLEGRIQALEAEAAQRIGVKAGKFRAAAAQLGLPGLTAPAQVAEAQQKAQENRVLARKMDLDRRVLDVVRTHSPLVLSARFIASAVGSNHHTVGASLKRLEAAGRVRQVGSEHRPFVYGWLHVAS